MRKRQQPSKQDESACLETKKYILETNEKNTILHKTFCVTGRIMHRFFLATILNSTSKNKIHILT